jgi:SIT4-associating protein SAP185/190
VLPPIQSDVSGDSSNADADVAEQTERERERDRARDEFWSDADEERDRKREIIRGMWVKVNGALITKRTTEVSEKAEGARQWPVLRFR